MCIRDRDNSGEARDQLLEKIAREEESLAALDAQIASGEADLENQKQQAMEALGRLGDVKSALSRMEEMCIRDSSHGGR